jgi:outer membrane protein TolC
VATPVTVDEGAVVATALASHPLILAAREDSSAADASATAADRARLPDVTVTARYARLSSIPARYRTFGDAVFPQLLDNVGARAELALPLTDAFLGLAAAARAAGHKAEAAQLDLETARARVTYEARVAVLTYASRAYARKNAEEFLRVAEKQAEDLRSRVAAGTAARNDALPYETALDAARSGFEAAKADVAVAEQSLYTFAPDLRGKRLEAPPLAALAPVVPPGVPGKETPRVAALEAEHRAADAAQSAAKWSQLPRISAYVVGDVSAPSPRVFLLTKLEAIPTWEAGVRLELSLSQATVGAARSSEARHRAEALAAQVANARRAVDAERASAVAELQAAERRIRLADARVARARELAKARQGERDAGTALPLNVVVAQADVLRAENEQVDAVVEAALALAKIDFADGRIGKALP